ncbi:50S ribosomal protein L4 [Nocardioides sp. JQ2195]|uniref:50S ribosomal protein L4, sunset domain variant n=1 Tax=Nocardioides sp. JQ2195 TaxID=2592334 RepID=UPI00143E6439|nr:50S ribosomal protein L4 [Nocardioides sp. JQ2195]QIX25751.1 50S ribosomal protein L4 [Nocardioides sp. JQ2195]
MSANANVKVVSVDLPAEIFDVQVSVPLMHQVVVAQQAAARQGTHATKTRADVRGGGRKPYKQKGTGRARQGSTRAPQFAGGGIVHGPQPRDYDQRTPKKMKAAALKGALTDRATNGRVHVVEALVSGEKPSTRDAIAALASLSDRARFLVVLERSDSLTWLSLRNAPEVHILAVDQLNTYDVLLSDDVVFTKGAFDALVAGTPKGKSVKAVAAESETVEAPAEVTSFAAVADADHAGGAQPLENGEAPEGYEVKGNKDSMKFHAPGGRWYDATVAEVWFKTAADAEAAGFVEAGKKAAATEEDDK